MTDAYFKENNKFLGLSGIINRRNFIVNFLILEIIEALILTTPLLYLLFTNPDMMLDFSSSAMRSNVFPIWYSIWLGIAGLIESILFFPSIIRRVRDIVGEVDENKVCLVASVLAVLVLIGYTPANNVAPLFRIISLFVIFILMMTKGKISSKKPKSKIAKFNWGACFGTWMWGLYNKSYITALMLPLLLTTGWFPFMLICGIKGNEWAYEKNKKYSEIEDFHKSQSNQSALWAVVTPIIVVLGFIGIIIGSGVAVYCLTKENPKFTNIITQKAAEYQEVAVQTNFEKIELTDSEYKFYIDPQIWVKLPENSKKSMFQLALTHIAKEKNINVENTEARNEFKGIEIYNKIKIYSSFNNELLGEYTTTPAEMKKSYQKTIKGEKGALKEYINTMNSGYKFNEHPTLP